MSRQEQVLAEIYRELAAALSVTPSADFEARVLQRVDEDEVPGRSNFAWLAAAACIVLVAGLFYALNRTPAVDPAPARQVVERGPDVVLSPATPRPVTREDPSVVAGATPAPPPTVARRPEPEVIVPLNQMEAVRRLVRAVNEGRIEAPAEPKEGPMPVPAELAVAPLVVDPIPVPALAPEPGTEKPSRDI